MKFYPVLSLPTEIVIEIFMHFIPVYPLPVPLLGIESPTTLAQICRDWREIALATPALWRSISMSDVREEISQSFDAQAALSRHWLRRSHPFPLSLHFSISLHSFGSCAMVCTVRRGNLALPRTMGVSLIQQCRTKRCCRRLRWPAALLRHLDMHFDLDWHRSEVVVLDDTPRLSSAVLNLHSTHFLRLRWAHRRVVCRDPRAHPDA